MATIRLDALQGAESDAAITNVDAVASYNWIESPTPTIAVPGIPAQWCPAAMPRRVPKDSGLVYIAQNAARHPEHPLEPLFRALYHLKPDFDMDSVHLVSDRNNLRKLLSFVDPTTNPRSREDFTIDVEVAGGTVILCRTETKVSEFIGRGEYKGFGHEYEKAYTSSAISNSTGHHRIISYNFGGMRFLVRHEVDGYVKNADLGRDGSAKAKTQDGDLSDLLGSMSLNTGTTPPLPVKATNKPAGSKMTILEQGDVVDLGSTLEIKTRVAHKKLGFDDVAAQLWVSQTPMLVRAYHRQRGLFDPAGAEDMTARVKAWEQSKRESLKKLVALVKKIIEVAKEMKGSAVVKYRGNANVLVVEKKTDSKPMLPADLYEKWSASESAATSTKAV